jgi:hypothetical protein
MPNSWDELNPQRGMFNPILKWLGFGLILLAIFGIVAFGLGWIGAGAQVVSPDNVRQQYAKAYDDYNALKALAGNVCDMQKAEAKASPGSTEQTQRTSQRLAYEQQYRNVKAQYDARYADIFRAQKVGPPDLPKEAPTVEQMLVNVGCTK